MTLHHVSKNYIFGAPVFHTASHLLLYLLSDGFILVLATYYYSRARAPMTMSCNADAQDKAGVASAGSHFSDRQSDLFLRDPRDDDQPSAKRQKKYEADGFGPIEDDKTAREKLREAGFDPDDVHTGRSDLDKPPVVGGSWHNITPMTYFALCGDLPMCRYLHHVRGASTTIVAEENRTNPNADVFWFPMYAAVQKQNYLVAKWLFQEGAVKDLVCMHVRGHPSPIKILFTQVLATEAKEATCLAKWFVTQGAIQFWMQARVRTFCGNKEIATLGNDVGVHHLEWSGDLIRSTSAFHLFLLGTLPAPQYSASALENALTEKTGDAEVASLLVQNTLAAGNETTISNRLRRHPGNNECLGSHPGILKHIGDFVGIIQSKTELDRIKEFHETLLLHHEKAKKIVSSMREDGDEDHDEGGY